jgi:hypothetical protein
VGPGYGHDGSHGLSAPGHQAPRGFTPPSSSIGCGGAVAAAGAEIGQGLVRAPERTGRRARDDARFRRLALEIDAVLRPANRRHRRLLFCVAPVSANRRVETEKRVMRQRPLSRLSQSRGVLYNTTELNWDAAPAE